MEMRLNRNQIVMYAYKKRPSNLTSVSSGALDLNNVSNYEKKVQTKSIAKNK